MSDVFIDEIDILHFLFSVWFIWHPICCTDTFLYLDFSSSHSYPFETELQFRATSLADTGKFGRGTWFEFDDAVVSEATDKSHPILLIYCINNWRGISKSEPVLSIYRPCCFALPHHRCHHRRQQPRSVSWPCAVVAAFASLSDQNCPKLYQIHPTAFDCHRPRSQPLVGSRLVGQRW